MEKRLKTLIIEDYKNALDNLNQIVSGKKPNFWVLKPNQYLSPSIRSNILPLDDKHGEFFHYNVICETLERLLARETLEYTCQFRDAPEEIKELLDKAA
ncbi:hypothetical protein ES702_05427 [subsurface metagenome]